MNFITILFYLFATVLLCAAFKVVTAKNPVHAVLFLVLAFATSACLWLLIQAEFLAIILILVYVGAVMVFFLFTVMMLNIDVERMRQGFWKNLPVASIVAGVAAIEIMLVLFSQKAQFLLSVDALPEASMGLDNAKRLGTALYTGYLLPFELASVLLTLAMVAAITLVHRKSRHAKYMNPAEQIKVKATEERVRIVKMATEVALPATEPESESQEQNNAQDQEKKS